MNLVLIKLFNGDTMTSCRTDQNYDDLADFVESLRAKHHPSLTVTGYAICDADSLADAMETGKDLDADFSVSEKSAVPGPDAIVCPSGMNPGDMQSTDDCVHFTP